MFIRDLKDGVVFRVEGEIPVEFKGGDIVNAFVIVEKEPVFSDWY